MARLLPLGLALLLLGTAAPAALAEDGPTGLAGETFLASETGGGTSDVSGTCNPLSTSSFSFTVTGTAIGPFPGTFVETGTFTIGAAPLFGLTSFDATFTIDSPNGTVTGSKSLAAVQPGTFVGLCGAATGFSPLGPDATSLQAEVDYTADLPGSASESGSANVTLQDTEVRGIPAGNGFSFVETFAGGVLVCEEDHGNNDCQGQDQP